MNPEESLKEPQTNPANMKVYIVEVPVGVAHVLRAQFE